MFTGIIEEIGKIKNIKPGSQSMKIGVTAHKVLEGTKLGDSIATNGVCLTVTRLGEDYFEADVMPETVNRSSLKHLTQGSEVNLERAMAVGERLGGHIVQGHVDGVGRIISKETADNATVIKIEAPGDLLRLMVDKGSIAIDGISLTIVEAKTTYFSVSIIPMTGGETTLLSKQVGDEVNLECDVIGKYVERLLTFQEEAPKETLTEDFLKQHGFM